MVVQRISRQPCAGTILDARRLGYSPPRLQWRTNHAAAPRCLTPAGNSELRAHAQSTHVRSQDAMRSLRSTCKTNARSVRRRPSRARRRCTRRGLTVTTGSLGPSSRLRRAASTVTGRRDSHKASTRGRGIASSVVMSSWTRGTGRGGGASRRLRLRRVRGRRQRTSLRPPRRHPVDPVPSGRR
jgi:hypothetical protein